MKIGIITFWDSQDNYGQLLQCYALQAYLKKLGHEPFLIRYKEELNYKSGFKISKCFEYLKHFKSYFSFVLQSHRNKKYELSNSNSQRGFDSFRADNLSMTQQVYNRKELMDNPPFADVYICGSDQIWGGSDIYYLSFVPDNAIKIAYAPSLGGANPFMKANAPEIKRLLERFDFIGMREESGEKLLTENGISNVSSVVDPTLLLDTDDYLKFKTTRDNLSLNENKAFVYLLGSPIDCGVDSIFKYVSSKSMGYTYVASQGRADKYSKSLLSIPQWIQKISSCEFVVTNSFHCVVFSLIFHKPFIFIPLKGTYSRMNTRIYDLLRNCKLESQIFKGLFKDMSLDIDFTSFDEYKRMQVGKSYDIFQKYLTF